MKFRFQINRNMPLAMAAIRELRNAVGMIQGKSVRLCRGSISADGVAEFVFVESSEWLKIDHLRNSFTSSRATEFQVYGTAPLKQRLRRLVRMCR